MMTLDEKKIVMRAICMETVLVISSLTEGCIEAINQSDSLMRDFVLDTWERAQRHVQNKGNAHLIERQKLVDFDPQHKVRTVIGNMQIAYADLKESAPPSTDVAKLQLWHKHWKEEKAKNKRMKIMDPTSLPKRVRSDQDAAAEPQGRVDISRTGTIMRTTYNALCSHLLGILHDAIVMGSKIGGGAFGECRKINVKGISFLPEHITYCGKCYKGDSEVKFDNF